MSDSTEANKFLKKGEAQYATGNYYAAIDCYKQALNIFQNKNNYYGESQAFLEIAKIYQQFSQWAIYDAQKQFVEPRNIMIGGGPALWGGADGGGDTPPPYVLSSPPPPPPKSRTAR